MPCTLSKQAPGRFGQEVISHQVDYPKFSPLKGVPDPSAHVNSKKKKDLSRGGLERPLVRVGMAGIFVNFWMFAC